MTDLAAASRELVPACSGIGAAAGHAARRRAVRDHARWRRLRAAARPRGWPRRRRAQRRPRRPAGPGRRADGGWRPDGRGQRPGVRAARPTSCRWPGRRAASSCSSTARRRRRERRPAEPGRVGRSPDVVYSGGIPVANQSVFGITGDLNDYNVSSLSAGEYTLATASPLDSVRERRHDPPPAVDRRPGARRPRRRAGVAARRTGAAAGPRGDVTCRGDRSRSLHERVPVPSSRDEIAELASTMNGMLARLETASTTNRRLVSDASHELRTPIAVMRAELDVARRRSTPTGS